MAWLNQILPSVGAMYTKRLLEKHYDALAETTIGQKIRQLSPWTKGALELLTYVVSALAELKLKDGTPLARYLKDVGVDFAPEMSKRMINGAKAREVLTTLPISPGQRPLIETLLGIEDDGQLSDLIAWIFGQGEERWSAVKNILSKLSKLPGENLGRFNQLDSDTKEKIVAIFASHPPASLVAEIGETRQRIQSLTEKINAARARIQKKT